MTRLIRILIILLVALFTFIPAFSAIKGGVDYKIPMDYSKINQKELESEAEQYYKLAAGTKEINENMTAALNLYTMLTNAYPDNIQYAIKLGKLYEMIGKDRYAKGQYFKAISIDSEQPEPYFCLGEYYYSKEQYRKALKFYLKAYDKGYSTQPITKEKLNLIYKKFGDTEKASKYLNP